MDDTSRDTVASVRQMARLRAFPDQQGSVRIHQTLRRVLPLTILPLRLADNVL